MSLTGTVIETFKGTHYPACNDRCEGDMHWLDGGPDAKELPDFSDSPSARDARAVPELGEFTTAPGGLV